MTRWFLFGFPVEGKGSKKEKAKEDAATEMIRLIMNEQNAKTLSSQFKPFDEQEWVTETIIFNNGIASTENSLCLR